MRAVSADGQRIYTAGGGSTNAMSLAAAHGLVRRALRSSSAQRGYPAATLRYSLGGHGQRDAERDFGWRVEIPICNILEEIADHAERNPDWLERSGAVKRPAPEPREPIRLLSMVIPARNEEGLYRGHGGASCTSSFGLHGRRARDRGGGRRQHRLHLDACWRMPMLRVPPCARCRIPASTVSAGHDFRASITHRATPSW